MTRMRRAEAGQHRYEGSRRVQIRASCACEVLTSMATKFAQNLTICRLGGKVYIPETEVVATES